MDTVCTEYEAPDGQIYTVSGEYVATIPNAEGCDSVITIHITVNGITATGNSVEATPGFADGYASVVVTGGTPPFTYLWDDPFFQTSSIAIGLFPGSYTCLISDAVGCTATVEVEVELFTGIPSIHLNDTYCNASGFVLSDFIACIGVENAEAYRWELTEAGENSLPEYTRIGNKYLRLLWVSGIELGTTYEVRVKARVGGIWGEYGDVCTITTVADIPLTEVRPQYHPTNAAGNEYALCDMISAYNVANSTNFRWRFDPDTDSNNGNELYYTRGVGNPSIRLSWVDGLLPETNYNVAVEAAIQNTWRGFGSVHEIHLSPVAEPEIRNAFCDQTISANGYILSESVCEANYYRFRFEPVGGGAISLITSGNYVAFLNNASPALSTGDYNVSVQVSQAGVLGEFGASCPMTISGSGIQEEDFQTLRMIEHDFAATIYPNPNSGNEVFVGLDGLPTETSVVSIEIFDVYGRKLSHQSIHHQGEEFGQWIHFQENIPMGMYVILIEVNQEMSSVHRMVVK